MEIWHTAHEILKIAVLQDTCQYLAKIVLVTANLKYSFLSHSLKNINKKLL